MPSAQHLERPRCRRRRLSHHRSRRNPRTGRRIRLRQEHVGPHVAAPHRTHRGVVRFDGSDITALSPRALREARREMQIIFQDPFGSLDPRLTVEDIVTEPLAIHDDPGKPILRQHAAELMRAVGLEVTALSRYPHEFSGGQRQRIGIAAPSPCVPASLSAMRLSAPSTSASPLKS